MSRSNSLSREQRLVRNASVALLTLAMGVAFASNWSNASEATGNVVENHSTCSCKAHCSSCITMTPATHKHASTSKSCSSHCGSCSHAACPCSR